MQNGHKACGRHAAMPTLHKKDKYRQQPVSVLTRCWGANAVAAAFRRHRSRPVLYVRPPLCCQLPGLLFLNLLPSLHLSKCMNETKSQGLLASHFVTGPGAARPGWALPRLPQPSRLSPHRVPKPCPACRPRCRVCLASLNTISTTHAHCASCPYLCRVPAHDACCLCTDSLAAGMRCPGPTQSVLP